MSEIQERNDMSFRSSRKQTELARPIQKRRVVKRYGQPVRPASKSLILSRRRQLIELDIEVQKVKSAETEIQAQGKEKGAPAWDREPRKARFVASVVFTLARGVIHPSFPLRGRLGTNC
jgi:hypothetical protein